MGVVPELDCLAHPPLEGGTGTGVVRSAGGEGRRVGGDQGS